MQRMPQLVCCDRQQGFSVACQPWDDEGFDEFSYVLIAHASDVSLRT